VETDWRPLFDTIFIIVIAIVFARWYVTRITIQPEIRAELTMDDYFAGRDPVLEAIVAASTNSD
jgi:hypothetical protein